MCFCKRNPSGLHRHYASHQPLLTGRLLSCTFLDEISSREFTQKDQE